MNDYEIFAMILVSAAINLCLRAIPFVFLGRKKEVGPKVQKLGDMLPAAIMAILVIYCIRNITVSGMTDNVITLVSVAVTAMLHIWKKNTILSISGGTVLYMILVHVI